MKLYETTFIINPQTDDATIDRHVKEIADLITGNKGKIVYTEHMGTRRLAYAINGLTQGYYASFIFEGPTSILPVMEHHFRMNEAYIRDLTVCFEGNLQQLLDEQSGGTHGEMHGGSERPERPVEGPRPAPVAPAPIEAKAEETEESEEPSEADETPSEDDTPEETSSDDDSETEL